MEITPKHVEKLKNKVFKILPLFQSENVGLTRYIDSLIYELEGLRNRLNEEQESMMITIISVLEHMYDDSLSPSPDIDIIKREVFSNISLIEKMFNGDKYESF